MTARGAERTSSLELGRQGLRFRVYVLTTVAVLASAIVVGGFSWWRLRQLDSVLIDIRRRAVVAVAEHLDEETSGDLETLQRLASSPQISAHQEGTEGARGLLRSIYLLPQFARGVFLLDQWGEVVAQEGRSGHSIAPAPDLPDVRAGLRDGKPRVTALVGSKDDARTYALVPITDWRGKPVGIVGAVLDPAQALRTRVLRHLQLGSQGHAEIVDANGVVLASTDPTQLGVTVPCHVRISKLVHEREVSVGRCRGCHAPAVPWVMAIAPLSSAPWAVTLLQPESAVLATSGVFPGSFPVFAVGLILLAGVFAWGAVRSMTRPIAVLTRATERISAGALDETIPELGHDELGRLGQSIERMRSSLRDMIGYVARANEALEQRVGERTRELARANDQLRDRDAQRQRMLRMVITAQEDERKRIARELHDETTQSLAVLVMGIESAASAVKAGGPQPRLDEVKALAVKTLEEVHRLILDLRPAVLDDLGLFSALRWYAERYLGDRGMAVRCEISELERRLPPEIEIAVFRIGQEVMNNIARHAHAESVLIQLAATGRELSMEIEDDGAGFDPAVVPQDRPHYGLMGVRERAELLGGKAIIESAPGQGTRVEVRIPLPDEAAPPPSPGRAPGLSSAIK